METKRCSKCGEEKILSEFNKDKKAKDGLRYICISCSKDISKQWYCNNLNGAKEYAKQWAKNNPEKRKESQKVYRKNNKERINENNRERYHLDIKESREKYRILHKKLYDANPDKFIINSKEWKKENSEHVKKYNRKYKKTQSDELSKIYIKDKLKAKGFSDEMISDELIEAQRLIIKIKRLTNQKTKLK